MGVYIKSMEMPISCFGCSTKVDPDTRCCNIDGHLFEETFSRITSRRDEACPLVYVPPHGRLIDADALLERFEKEEKAADEHGRDFSFSFKSGGENCTEWWPVQVMLMDAPTIIPADPAEEGNGDVE